MINSMRNPDPCLSLPLNDLIELAIEYWRIAKWIDGIPAEGGAPARYALRKLAEFLRRCDLEIVDMTGKPCEPGMAVMVVDTLPQESKGDGQSIVCEMLSPIVLWRGNVVKDGEVVTMHSDAKATNKQERKQ